MDINQLYDKLKSIFQEYTTHNWKNGWQHEGDRLSTELTIQKNVPWNNLFLLSTDYKGFYLDGPQGFRLEVKTERENLIRIDIEAKQINDLDIYYYVNNQLDWQANQDFLVELCQVIYDTNVKIREALEPISQNTYGTQNPEFITKFRRDRLLQELL